MFASRTFAPKRRSPRCLRTLPEAPPAPPPCHHTFFYRGSGAKLRALRVSTHQTVARAPASDAYLIFNTVQKGIENLRRKSRFDTLSKEALNRRSRPLRATEETAGFEHELSGRKRAFGRAPPESSWGRRSRYSADPSKRPFETDFEYPVNSNRTDGIDQWHCPTRSA